MKVLIVTDHNGSGTNYYEPFKEFGELTFSGELLWDSPENVSLVVFTGGADVLPSLYGEESIQATIPVPNRDIWESIVFCRARYLNIPMFGICRGAQFLNVMAGGKLCQHLDGHNNNHEIDIDNDRFYVTSSHHQMMLPPKDAKIIGWSSEKRSKKYIGEKNQLVHPEKEYEIVYWDNIKAVGVQYHPEIMTRESKGFKLVSYLVKKYLCVFHDTRVL